MAKVCMKGTTQQARTRRCNVAMQHTKGDATEATHDKGAMRQGRCMRGAMQRGQHDRARVKAAHDEGAEGQCMAKGRCDTGLWEPM
jgi:hypothetical protein